MKMAKNEAQEKAIDTIKGYVGIVSVPGSGKTATITRRSKNIINHGYNPKKILTITFSKASAIDMEERYIKMYGKNPGIIFSTIHALCFGILKKQGLYDRDSVLTEGDKWDYFFNILKNNSDIGDPTEFIKNLLTEISVVKNNYIDIYNYDPQSCKKDSFIKYFKGYENYKEEVDKIDFDDMLIEVENLFKNNPNILDRWQNRFTFIQVDEYQDVNLIQKNIIYLLAGKNNNLCVVGDDDQAIYGFRGASSDIMLNFPNDFKNTEMINMSTNYRSGQRIINVADSLIKHNIKRFPKNFISYRGEENNVKGYIEYKKFSNELSEIDNIVKLIKEKKDQGVDLKEIAILFRINDQAQMVATKLIQEDIPFTSTEKIKTIYDSYMFEHLRAYVELSMGFNTKKNLFKVLNRPNRFLSFKHFKNTKFNYESMMESIEYLKKGEYWKYEKASDRIGEWMNSFGPGKITLQTNPADVFYKMNHVFGINYRDYIEKITEFKKQNIEEELLKWEMLEEDACKHNTIAEWFNYIDELEEKIKEMAKKEKEDAVVLSTMHKSKGMEWENVFIIGFNKGLIPFKKATELDEIEEERRLFYVGMTRAKDNLYISSSDEPSEFLVDIDYDLERIKEEADNKENDLEDSEELNVKNILDTSIDASKDDSKKTEGDFIVEHKRYKNGEVLDYLDNYKYVLIKFDGDVYRKFPYPESFNTFELSVL